MYHLIKSNSLKTKSRAKNIFNLNTQLLSKIFSILALFALLLSANQTLAVDNQTLEQQKKSAQEKLNQTSLQKVELSEQIKSFDNIINDTQSEIINTANDLDALEASILEKGRQITDSEAEIAKKREQISDFIRVMYINGQVSNVELVFASNSLSDFLDRSEYIEAMQNNIKTTADQISKEKEKLESQKTDLEISKAKISQLLAEQIAKQNEIESKKSAKNRLLEITKGDEAEYKKLIANIQKQINDNNNSVWGGSVVSQGSVKKGDIIGYIGNSGYSTGAHLHFEIRDQDKNTVNPTNYMNNGYFIDPAPSVPINARYGRTSDYFWCDLEDDWCFHSGIDKADGGMATPVRAAADGEIIARFSGYGNTYPNQYIYGNYVKILHTNGMYSLYGHLR